MSGRNKFANLKKWILIAFIVLSALAVRLYLISRIKVMSRQEDLLIVRINQAKDKADDYLVKIQKLTSEERITDIAEKKLGLIKSVKPLEKLKVDYSTVKRIEKLVNKRYE